MRTNVLVRTVQISPWRPQVRSLYDPLYLENTRLPLQQSMLFMLENTAVSISLCSSRLKILLSLSVYAVHAWKYYYQYQSMLFMLESTTISIRISISLCCYQYQSMQFTLENTAISISLCSSRLKILLSVSVYAVHCWKYCYQYQSMQFTVESTAFNFFTGNNTALISLFSYLIFLSLLLYFSSYHLFCFILLYHLISAPKPT